MKKLSEIYKEQGIAFKYPIVIRDRNGNRTYFETSYGNWNKREYDANGNTTFEELWDGFWWKAEYDDNGNNTYYENNFGRKEGIPRSKSCDGKVVEIDSKKYQLKEL